MSLKGCDTAKTLSVRYEDMGPVHLRKTEDPRESPLKDGWIEMYQSIATIRGDEQIAGLASSDVPLPIKISSVDSSFPGSLLGRRVSQPQSTLDGVSMSQPYRCNGESKNR